MHSKGYWAMPTSIWGCEEDDFECFGENQEASEKKRKVFQYMRRDGDTKEGNGNTSVDKGKITTTRSGSTQKTIN